MGTVAHPGSSPPPDRSAVALLHQATTLAVRDPATGRWHPLLGDAVAGESARGCAVRQVYQQTGLLLGSHALTHVADLPDGEGHIDFYTAPVPDPAAVRSPDHGAWVPVLEAVALPARSAVAEFYRVLASTD